MEASLKPQVLEALDNIAALYKKLGRLQDASVEAALASDELSTGQERRFKKLRNETMDLVKGLKLNNNRIEALVDQMYGINRRLVSLEGRRREIISHPSVSRSLSPSRPLRYHRQSPLTLRTVTTGITQQCRPPRPPTGR